MQSNSHEKSFFQRASKIAIIGYIIGGIVLFIFGIYGIVTFINKKKEKNIQVNLGNNGNEFPLKRKNTSEDSSFSPFQSNKPQNDWPASKPILYDTAQAWHERYLENEKRLTYNVKKPSQTIQGFSLHLDTIQQLMNRNQGMNELYVFFGTESDAKGNVTVIFSELLRDSIAPNDIDTIVSPQLLYEYVRPCPPYCPKFK